MADNIPITPGTGDVVAADDIAGAKHQRVKLVLGADGVSDGDVSTANPMPVKNQSASTAALSNVASSTSSVSLIAANANRKGLIVHCDSTGNALIAFAATASATAFTFRLNSQATYNMPFPIYTGQLSVICSNTNGALRITELT
jgi:hypothetical protein